MKLGILTFLFLAFFGGAFAADKFKDIPHKDLVEAVKAGKVTLLDCNKTLVYNKNHIPGAIDYGKNKAQLATKLPAEKSALIVAYCGDPDCGAYKEAANAAVELGYTNVKFYSGGIVGWLKEKEKTESVEAKL